MATTEAKTRIVGTNVLRRQDPRLLTGRGMFVADVQRPGTLHLAILRSPHAHARLARLDASAARRLPGVHLILTGQDIADRVKSVVEACDPDKAPISVVTTSSDDVRSYRLSSEAITRELGFLPTRTVEEAVQDLCRAFRAGKVPEPLSHARYYNIRTMKAIGLT